MSLSQRFSEWDSREGLVDEPVDARRYVEALRDRAGLILGLAAVVAVLVGLISLALPKSYTASAKIAPSVQATTIAASGSPAQLNFATLQAYVTSPTVLASAGRKLGASPTSLQQKVTTSLDASANIVNITASDGDARRSAQIANGVAETFLSVRTAAERAQLAAQANLLTPKMLAARATGSSGLAASLQQQISNVLAQEASAGSDLQMLALAPVPGSASSPRPARNAFFAFVVVLFIGVLAVAGRELLAPTISGERELSTLMRMPVLGRIPRVAPEGRVRRTAADASEAEAYRFLSKSIDLGTWPSGCRVLAVTSAVRGEGKTTVVSRLGAAFAEAGSKTLLVCADLRRPMLDRVFGLAPDDGLGNVLSSPNGSRAAAEPSQIEHVGEKLYVLPCGRPLQDPAAVITNDVVRSLVERVRQLSFEYVLFDLPPLIDAAETQLFVRYADAAMVVSMVGRANAEQLSETRELLSRLAVRPAGIVVLGVRTAGRRARWHAVEIADRPAAGARPVSDQGSAPLPSESSFKPSESTSDPELPMPAVIPEASDPAGPAEPAGSAQPAALSEPPSEATTSAPRTRPASRRRTRQKASATDGPAPEASTDASASPPPAEATTSAPPARPARRRTRQKASPTNGPAPETSTEAPASAPSAEAPTSAPPAETPTSAPRTRPASRRRTSPKTRPGPPPPK
ncbi:MAG TPA: Wzz/FepE/Etk N-terminal domain-containing protein [Solirubrobacteraceae bacterium]